MHHPLVHERVEGYGDDGSVGQAEVSLPHEMSDLILERQSERLWSLVVRFEVGHCDLAAVDPAVIGTMKPRRARMTLAVARGPVQWSCASCGSWVSRGSVLVGELTRTRSPTNSSFGSWQLPHQSDVVALALTVLSHRSVDQDFVDHRVI